MALTGAQYQSMRLKFRGLLSNPFQFVSEAELDSFIGQLAIDATGSVTATQKTQADALLAGALTSPAYTAQSADVATFFTQVLTAAPVIVLALVGARYQQLKNQLTGALSIAGVRTEAQMLGYMATYIANNPLKIISSTTVKLWVDSQLGTAANTWTDQSGSGNSFTEATNPPILTSVGGVPCYVGNGTSQKFTASALTLTLGQWYWIIAQQISWTTQGSLCGGPSSVCHSFFQTIAGASPQLTQFNGNQVNINSAMSVGSWFRLKALFGNTTADYNQPGPIGNKVTGAATGSSTETGWGIFCRGGAFFGNFAIAAIVACPAEPTAPEQAALDAYGLARWPTVTF